jgi:hypothetical protein
LKSTNTMRWLTLLGRTNGTCQCRTLLEASMHKSQLLSLKCRAPNLKRRFGSSKLRIWLREVSSR